MRTAYSQLITDAALADKNLLLLTGDHGYALFDQFRKACPDQFINCGVAEQNMVGVAAGLAKAGFRPLVYGLAAFVPMRVLEQIKMDICYESLPVILIGDGAGVVYSQLGASHQSTEDIAALRAIPNIDIFSPADKFELSYCFKALLASKRPGYLRFGKADCGNIHTQVPKAPIGDLLPVRGGDKEYALLATGSMVSVAVKVADALGNVRVWSVPSVTPVNRSQLAEIGRRYKKIFTLEEHSVHGGLGGMVAEVLSETGQTNIIRIGIRDKFSELCGSWAYQMSYHGLSAEQVKETILKALG